MGKKNKLDKKWSDVNAREQANLLMQAGSEDVLIATPFEPARDDFRRVREFNENTLVSLNEYTLVSPVDVRDVEEPLMFTLEDVETDSGDTVTFVPDAIEDYVVVSPTPADNDVTKPKIMTLEQYGTYASARLFKPEPKKVVKAARPTEAELAATNECKKLPPCAKKT